MKIADYTIGDTVEVLMNNPRNDNKDEWREATILDRRTIYPSGGSHHPPYPMLIVRVVRTYCKATPTYRWLAGNIPVFVDNTLEFYEKENDEGFVYDHQVRPKTAILTESV